MTSLATETRADARDTGVRRPRDRAGRKLTPESAPPAPRNRKHQRRAQRQSIGKVLRRGPLFQAETTQAFESPTTPDPATELRRWQIPNQLAQPGWVFVASSEQLPGCVRIGIAEAEDSELRKLRANLRVSRDLRLRDGETLRYSVFASDVYAALNCTEAFLKEFKVDSEHYRVHSAAAATTIETCGVQLRARRSNFEPIQLDVVDENLSEESPPMLTGAAPHDSVPVPTNHRERKRGAQRQQLASVVSEVGRSIALASETLQESTRLLAGSTYGGILRPVVTASLSKGGRPEQGFRSEDIQRMEKWVMRREAIEYLKLRRLQFAQRTAVSTIAGAAAGLLLYLYADRIASEYGLGMIMFALAAVSCALSAIVFWLRYRKGVTVWRKILDNCSNVTVTEINTQSDQARVFQTY